MWTTRTANRTSLAFELLACSALLTMGVDAALDQNWDRAVMTLAATGVLVTLVAWRSRSQRRERKDRLAPIVERRAVDEHGAYIQLRAWALTGQVATAMLIVALIIAAVRTTDTSVSPVLWPLLALLVTYEAAVRWLTRRA